MEPGEEVPKLKEIYAYFGYSMFLYQVLEGVLIQAIYAFVIFPANKKEIQNIVKNNSMSDWEQFIDSHDMRLIRKTMGALIKKLQNNESIPTEVVNNLKAALEKRNHLAHSYYKENLAKFYTEEGQEETILFLRRSGGIIQRAIDNLTSIVKDEMCKYGYNEEFYEDYGRKALADAQKNL